MQMQERSLQLQFLFRLVHFKLHLRKSTVPDYLRGPILKMTSLIVLQAEQPLCQHTDAVSTSLNYGSRSCHRLCFDFRKLHNLPPFQKSYRMYLILLFH